MGRGERGGPSVTACALEVIFINLCLSQQSVRCQALCLLHPMSSHHIINVITGSE